LKNGSILDLPASLRPANLIPYLAVGATNLGLVKYLVGELLKSKSKKFESLLEFMPTANPADWQLLNAGQRAQIIKKDAAKGGVLQFGTEIITSADGSISGLLGASPGASTAVFAMLEVLKTSFPKEFKKWEPKLTTFMPSYGTKLNADAKAAAASLKATAKVLKIK
jgi:malate dehydrogenase (quinone)